MSYKSFQDYLEVKMQPVEKPPVEQVPDYHGKPNPFVKKEKERKNCCGEDGKKLAGTPKTEEIPDYHGEKNPEAREFKASKNTKKSQVLEATSFKEYLDAKGKMKDPEVTINVNFTQPEGPTSGMAGPSGGGKALPYVAKSEKGDDWGKLGSVDPYVPKTDVKKDTEVFEPLVQKKTKQQPQAESVIKNMRLAEVTVFLQKQNKLLKEEGCTECEDIPKITAWSSGKIMPDPIETIEYITHLASQNTELMNTLVSKLKGKKGGMSGLIERLLDHPETMKEFVGHLDGEKGQGHAGSLARTMAETYHDYMDKFNAVNESALSPAIGFDDEDMPSDSDDYEDSDSDSDDSDDSDDVDDSDAPDEDLPSHSDEDDDLPSHDDDDELPELPKKVKKPSRTFAHDHIIEAMGGHKHQLDAMKSHCEKCGN